MSPPGPRNVPQAGSPPLSPAEVKRRVNFLARLADAVANARLYAVSHPVTQAALREAQALLEGLLRSRAELSLTFAEKEPIFDGVPLFDVAERSAGLLAKARERGIEAVLFRQGATLEELTTLVEFLTLPEDAIETGEGVRHWFERKGVRSLVVGILRPTDQPAREVDPLRVRALERYSSAILAIRAIMDTASTGAVPDVAAAEDAVRQMAESILESDSALTGLASLKDYDAYTYTHSVHVSVYAMMLGKSLRLGEPDLVQLGLAGVLHDIGKQRVPSAILNKPGKLNDLEWQEMQRHPFYGARLLHEAHGTLSTSARAAFEHHLNFDLSGYPKLTRPREVSVFSLAIGIADFYDALTTVRPYKAAVLPDKTLEMMAGLAGKQFEPRLVDRFIAMLGLYPVGCVVRLDTGEFGVVYEANLRDGARPKVKLMADPAGGALEEFQEVDLMEQDSASHYLRSIVQVIDPVVKGLDPRRVLEGHSTAG